MNEVKFKALLDIEGEEKVLSAAAKVESALNQLKAYKDTSIKLKVEAVGLERERNKITRLLREAESKRANLKVESPELDAVAKKLKEVENEIDRLNKKQVNIKAQTSALDSTIARSKELQNEASKVVASTSANSLQKYMAKFRSDWYGQAIKDARVQKGVLTAESKSTANALKAQEAMRSSLLGQQEALRQSSPEYKKLTSDIDHYNKAITNLNDSLADNRLAQKENNIFKSEAADNVRALNDEVRAAQQNIERFASSVERGFSTAGSVISKTGSALQGLGDMFGGRVINTAKTMATAFATMGLYSAAQGTVSRYDTMRMYPKQMELLGFRADQAAASVDKLEQSVIGLPTGLDEIVESARQLVTLTGDLNKGTDLAIAANNALLAGGTDAQQQVWGQRQIRDLLSAGKLRSQEWESLIKALGPGLKDIGEAMGYADYGQFRSELKQNKVAAEDFLDALVQVGTGEGVLAQRAELYKDTLSATARNIKNAVQKLGAAGLDALDKVLENETGKNLPQTIVEISDAIKGRLVPALEGWIGDHSGDIVNFLDRLKNYDWIGLVSKAGNGLAHYYDLMTGFFTKVSPKVVSFLAVWGGPIGRMLQVASSGVDGLGRIIGAIIRVAGKGKLRKAAEVADAVGDLTSVGKAASGFANAFKGLGLAAGGVGLVAEIGAVIFEYAKIMESISNIKMGSNLSANIDAIAKLSGKATLFATGLTTFFGAFSTIPGFAGFAATGELLSAGFIGIIGEIGLVIQTYAKALDSLASADVPSDSRMSKIGHALKIMKDDVVGNIPTVKNKDVDSMKRLKDIVDDMGTIASGMKEIKSLGQIGDMTKNVEGIVNASLAIAEAVPKKIDKKLADKMEQLASATESTLSIADNLVNMKKKMTYLSSNGQNGRKRYENLADQLNGLFGEDGLGKVFLQFTDDFKKIKKSTANFSDSVSNIAKIAETVFNAKEHLKKITTKTSSGDFTSVTMKRLSTVLTGILDTFKNKGLDLQTAENVKAVKNLEGFASMSDSMSRTIESIFGMRKVLRRLAPTYRKNSETRTSLLESTLGDLYVAMANGGTTPMTVLKGRIVEVMRGLKDILSAINGLEIDPSMTEGVSDTMEKMSEMIGFITPMLEQLRDINLKGIGFKKGEFTLGTNLGKVIGGLQGAFTGLAGEDFVDLGENAKQLSTAVGYVTKIVSELHGVNAIISGLMGEDGTFTLGSKLAGIFASLSSAFSVVGPSLNGAGGVGSLASVAPQLQEIAKQLGAIGSNGEAAAGGLQSATTGVNSLGKAASTHSGAVKTLASNVGSLKSSLSGILGLGFTAAAGVTAVGNAAANQAGNLSAAAGAAAALAAAISSIPSNKTVNVSVGGNGGMTGTLTAVPAANGGPIYRANGGLAYFRPRGTDTIPAMLSPGEFVMRRKAHSAFGTAFMNSINRLDIDGAMRALSIKAGSGIFRKATVTNNYTRDNHSNLTFNINRASQGFTQRRASKWARSLS